MDRRKLIDKLVGPITFLVIYAGALVWIYPGNISEVENPEPYAREFRILAVKRGITSKPEYGSYTLSRLREARTDLSIVSFLLPEKSVDIRGPHRHQATVLKNQPDWQLIKYRYTGAHSAELEYRAYKDRIEPVSMRIRDQPGFLLKAATLLIPALIIAAAVRGTWRHATRRSRIETAVEPPRTGVLVKVLTLLLIAMVVFGLLSMMVTGH